MITQQQLLDLQGIKASIVVLEQRRDELRCLISGQLELGDTIEDGALTCKLKTTKSLRFTRDDLISHLPRDVYNQLLTTIGLKTQTSLLIQLIDET